MEKIIQRIGQVSIPVHNMKGAIEFYETKLGLQQLFSTDNMAFFDCNGIRLLLSIPEKEEFDHPSSIVYFQVENIHQSFDNLVTEDVTFVGKPHMAAKMGQTETWMAFFKDPDGNTHALMSEVQIES
ncbi:VOC family protein [Alkalihalobacillus sp. AL-G]|uniref:VOC family protein n=1 Tax=Alkalihalobacillus sp. AL-G TaxID=2926399 RepID=UPI002729AA49|nr:VOC family protein [Alkalihalobacillus sp. AL-G]WLD93311.1 VOC family protein [Alkalihalobacillus sp. AL-G]